MADIEKPKTANWIVYGVKKNDSREEVGSFPEWKDVIKWLQETWGMTDFYGLIIMPDDGMMKYLNHPTHFMED